MSARSDSQSSHQGSAAQLLRIAAWWGLIAGMVEGVGLLLVYGFGFFTLKLTQGVTVKIIWISALVDLTLFLLIALVGTVAQRFVPARYVQRACILLFVFLCVGDWAGLSAKISPPALLFLAMGATVMMGRWLTKNQERAMLWFSRSAVYVAAIAVFAFVCIQGGLWLQEEIAVSNLATGAPNSPNVLVIVVDTLRADHLSLYGYRRQTSPQLDRIARQGVVFDSAFSTAPWTLPSHASMLTGRLPHEHLAQGEHPIDAHVPMVSEALRARGYRTGGFSSNNLYFCRRAGLNRGFVHFEDYFYSVTDMFFRTFWGRVLNRYIPVTLNRDIPARWSAADVNHDALQWIEQDRKRPFFAFLNYSDVHAPYLPIPGFHNPFRNAQPPASADPGSIDHDIKKSEEPYLYWLSRLAPAEYMQEVDRYDGSISYVDAQIANLWSELERRHLTENTVLIVTSDHGEAFGDHGLLCHRNGIYRELIHVPLIMVGPGRVAEGKRVSRPVSLASLPATIMDLAAAGKQNAFPVPSLAQLWNNPTAQQNWPDPVAEMEKYEFIPEHYPAHQGALKAIMSPQWQLITGDHSRPELYDWVRDPRELQNQASSPDGQHVVSQLTARLRLRTATPSSELSRTAPAQPPAARQMASQFTTK